jgi:tetratricopeptide (TPR) repeat protein
MKKYILILLVAFFIQLVGCDDLEYFPSDQLTSETVQSSEELLENVTIGTYSRLREREYCRLRHFLHELPGDDLAWCKQSGDHICNTYGYQRIVHSSAARQIWQQAYYGIYSANKTIEIIDGMENPSEKMLNLKGENLFIRGLMHFDLVKIFARPYPQNPESNLGVMIRNNTDQYALPARSTVKETFDFIVNDFLQSAELMKENKSSIFASKEAAWAMLSRIYLYMENYDKAIEYADKVINSGRYELVTTQQLSEYYTILPENNPETIFAIKLQASENMGKSSIGSLYHEDGGWGEIFVSKPFRQLIYQNPNDERIKFIDPKYTLDNEGNKIPSDTEESGYVVEKRLGYSKYFNLKYTLEGGVKMLSSPIVIRLAEMYLNKAEAFAKKGEEPEAIEMVNIIRQRAGLAGDELFSSDNLKGYQSVLDLVLDERRLELAYEGHRAYDVYRNNRSMDRSFTHGEAWAGPQLIPPTSELIVHFIPENEITLNPNLVQNP